MHEFSLAEEVIRLVQNEAERNKASSVSEITIEVGNICGVEVEAFRSALELLSENSILEGTLLNIVTLAGKGKCPSCNLEFDMTQRMDTCPGCGCFPSEIRGGDEFRVASVIIENE
jgi:hydrogenase nickel incorporation protein HypA/HybF